jgi:hypothetical protein
MVNDAEGHRVSKKACSALVTVAPGRDVHCTKAAGHSPAEDIHQGLLRATLPDGREVAASLVWSTSPTEWDQENLRRST